MNISYQQSLVLPLPNVYGPKDYREFRATLEQIDHLLITTGIESEIILNDLKKDNIDDPTQFMIDHRRKALRCNILKTLIESGYREYSNRFADSPLYQWFTGYNDLDTIQTPGKSTLERFTKHFDEAVIAQAVSSLLKAVSDPEQAQQLLNRSDEIKIEQIFADSTCIKAPIHFPVDWVLLRDGVRTLTKAILLIRREGLKNRMPKPESFISSMNSLCIAMSQARRKEGAKKMRKIILRKMKALSKTIQEHGTIYFNLLKEQWEITSWTFPQASLVLERIENVLEKLPAAIKQAHERIIGERQVKSADKILNLYEEDVHVIVRGKAGAEVEFGNGLYIAEQSDGLIVDWKFFQDQPPSDSALVTASVSRITEQFGKPKSYTGDRGFWSPENETELAEAGIVSGICPKSVSALQEKQSDLTFKALQKRRSQTEGRIAILKNVYLGKPLRQKGYKNRKLAVTWSVLVHNLCVIASIALKNADKDEEYIHKIAA